MSDWAHQLEANQKAGLKLGFGYFMQMGTGKTKCFIDKLREHMNRERKLMRILIFTPPMVVPQFKDEWKKFSQMDPKNITLLQGKTTKRLKQFLGRAFLSGGAPQPHIFITNYESLLLGGKHDRTKRGSPYIPGELYQAFERWQPEGIGYDEAQRLKNPEAQRSKQADFLANPYEPGKGPKPKPWTYMLTGTPLLNTPLDLFMVFKIMLGGFPTYAYMQSMGDPKYLIRNFYHFRDRFFRDRNAGMPKERHFPDWQIRNLIQDGYDAMTEIQEVIDHFSYRKLKSECMDLPEELTIRRPVPMSPAQAKAYLEMKTQLITYVNDKACVAKLAITKALRLLQISAGFVSVQGQGEWDDTADVAFDENPKLEALEELLETLTPHSKVLVWAVWKENYRAIRELCERLKIEIVESHGGVSANAKLEAVRRFKSDPAVRVFLGHPGSGGVGLNLVEASYSIFYSRTFSLEHYEQARSRNHRGGSEIHERITHYDLVCGGTIDELVLEALAEKREISAKILGDVTNVLAQQVPLE